MSMKRNKWIVAALEVLGYKVIEGVEKNEWLYTTSGLKLELENFKNNRIKAEEGIEDLKEAIETCDRNIGLIEQILTQAEIEEYRAMNPKAKAVYKF